MPELPEAEIARRSLAPRVKGGRVVGVNVAMPTRVRAPAPADPEAFTATLIGHIIIDVERRGKDVILALDNGTALEVNFGLWSWMILLDHRPTRGEVRRIGLSLELKPQPSAFQKVARGDENVRECLQSGGRQMTLLEERLFLVVGDVTFGSWKVRPYEPAPTPPPWDALDPELTGQELSRLGALPRSGRAGEVKSFLQDERALLGIGNGGADEMLWRARLHPRRMAASLTPDEWDRLLEAVREEFVAQLQAGGEDGFLDADGCAGTYVRRIHHHAGDPCPRCGTSLAGYQLSGRETNFCPSCQPAQTAP